MSTFTAYAILIVLTVFYSCVLAYQAGSLAAVMAADNPSLHSWAWRTFMCALSLGCLTFVIGVGFQVSG